MNMTIEEVMERIGEIRNIAGDYEVAHSLEDRLHLDVQGYRSGPSRFSAARAGSHQYGEHRVRPPLRMKYIVKLDFGHGVKGYWHKVLNGWTNHRSFATRYDSVEEVEVAIAMLEWGVREQL